MSAPDTVTRSFTRYKFVTYNLPLKDSLVTQLTLLCIPVLSISVRWQPAWIHIIRKGQRRTRMRGHVRASGLQQKLLKNNENLQFN